MTSAIATTSGAHALTFKIKTGTLVAATLLLASFGLFESASAQNIQPRPVARLISEPMAEARNSRPRRISLENSAAAERSVPSNSPALEDANAVERRAFDQTNVARAQNGLPALGCDADLCHMA